LVTRSSEAASFAAAICRVFSSCFDEAEAGFGEAGFGAAGGDFENQLILASYHTNDFLKAGLVTGLL
jgi:hypothetical protein